ncbi:MAG: ISL3 family transposase [Candidatus Electrothrix scaldis]|nr:MAG: ISL3 family transposase [Candidatus Electrothrix sp. GW3-3]WPD20815.1 MAG: ISL3 family transposase [Candidatus Electrothrix sp. GW3-3]WPD22764.1 MAG: ISL3 family transposase [Candidatus Electrothrix sp. GW3-3]WPD23253.1 MAG: ISL3 family transposase [Candidatus Electrothrix sp. GW3-3]WPD23621.1 MAG: ISL3 family transposase [Candidatus Electrothrix sp. GW3-3]
MKLLSLAYIKDAARSVKRVCEEMFTEATDSVLTELLGVAALKVNMYCLRLEGVEDVLHLRCSHRDDIAICFRCGTPSEAIHEEKERCVRHLDIWGKRTFLHFFSRRFMCEQCQKPFTESLPFIEKFRRHTKEFERHIYERCKAGCRKKVAIKEKLSQATVKEILNRFARRIPERNSGLFTRVLGIDEISLKKRHRQFVLVISDISSRSILAVLPDRRKDTLEKWLNELTEEQRRAIKFVSIDMWAPYAQAIRTKLPKSRLTVDRFHVMKQLNERLGQMRRKIQRALPDEKKDILKGIRWILVRNREELSTEEESRLTEVLALHPELRELYLIKEEFRCIFERVRSRDKASKFLRAWIWKARVTGNVFLLKFVGTLENWWNEVLNYFVERVTNGFVEGLNNSIRNIIRTAFGYRNFENFRLRVFAEHGVPH